MNTPATPSTQVDLDDEFDPPVPPSAEDEPTGWRDALKDDDEIDKYDRQTRWDQLSPGKRSLIRRRMQPAAVVVDSFIEEDEP